MMLLADLLKRVDELIAQGDGIAAKAQQSEYSSSVLVDYADAQGFRAAGLSFIARHFLATSPYYDGFAHQVLSDDLTGIKGGISILKAMRNEMAGGWLQSMKSLVSAEIFSDFLDMASHLLSEGYKDAAAVMIGGVLEDHLRQLCVKYGIDTMYQKDGKTLPKLAGMMNDQLSKAVAYDKMQHKAVEASIALRNAAAHGNYATYTKQQIEVMRDQVTNFIVQNPAP